MTDYIYTPPPAQLHGENVHGGLFTSKNRRCRAEKVENKSKKGQRLPCVSIRPVRGAA